MIVGTQKIQRGDLIYSLCKIDWLIARAKKPKSLYSRTQMETFSLLRETFVNSLKEHDANNSQHHHYC